jgi:hypothetical protein
VPDKSLKGLPDYWSLPVPLGCLGEPGKVAQIATVLAATQLSESGIPDLPALYRQTVGALTLGHCRHAEGWRTFSVLLGPVPAAIGSAGALFDESCIPLGHLVDLTFRKDAVA